MLDNHCKIAAIIHICLGAFLLATLAFVMAVLGGVAVFAQFDVPFVSWIAGFGAVVVGLFALFGLLQIGAAVAYLNGSAGARTLLIIFSIIALFNFPIGTAAGGYSLWALLRRV